MTEQAEDKGVSVAIVRSNKGDLVAEAFTPTTNPDEEKSLNAELLAAGLASSSKENCPNRDAFISAEQDAKERRVGIWR